MQKQNSSINKVIVKTEKAATRCEICHQSDLFDPETENCLRCSQVEKALATQPTVTRSLWSPRFALIQREDHQASYHRLPYLIAGILGALPIALFLENYIFFIVSLSLALILGLIYLAKRYSLGEILNSSINNSLTRDENSNRQITTLFDKNPEIGMETRRELPEVESKITTIFGDNNKKY